MISAILVLAWYTCAIPKSPPPPEASCVEVEVRSFESVIEARKAYYAAGTHVAGEALDRKLYFFDRDAGAMHIRLREDGSLVTGAPRDFKAALDAAECDTARELMWRSNADDVVITSMARLIAKCRTQRQEAALDRIVNRPMSEILARAICEGATGKMVETCRKAGLAGPP